jgi:hypothetical protein
VDYYHLPGTTTEQGTVSTPSSTDQSFVGGADVQNVNGVATYGTAAMSLHPALKTGTSTLYGKKSYFMLENEILCLGSGITCTSANQVHTTVENRRLGPTVSSASLWVNGVQTSQSLGSSVPLSNVKSCAIDGVAGYYFFNNPSNVQAAFQASSGAWTSIHPGDSDTTTYTDNYLKLYFNHGAKPTSTSYAYAILPQMSPANVTGYALNPQSSILANSTSVQAVKNATLGVVAANFWSGTGGTADLITANRACSVITSETYNRISIGIADPSQNLSGPTGVVTVTLNRAATGTISVDPGVTVIRTSPTIQLQASVGGAKGATFHASFSLSEAPVITSNLNMVGITGTPASYQITASGSPTGYDATGLPPGMSVNTATGLISGTPTQSGTYPATIIATNATGRSGYATLTINVSTSLSGITYTNTSSGTWICPANVTSVQVECWGGGGAGGSAYKPVSGNAFGGGGAGGAYAKKNSVTVVPGTSYTIAIGSGGVSAISPSLTTVSGGDSWFGIGSLTNCLAKGGAGGQSVISSGSSILGSGGIGSTSNCVGDIFYTGGNGCAGQGSPTNTGGGGGGSAGNTSSGLSATSYLGATAVNTGGSGGNGKDSTGNGNGSQGGSPGGGGGGARGSSVGSQTIGGTGGSGQVVLTVASIAAASNPAVIPVILALSNTNQTYDGSPKAVTVTSTPPGATPISVTYSNPTYPVTSNPPTDAGSYSVYAFISNSTYLGSTTGTLLISKASSSFTFDPNSLGSTYDPSSSPSVTLSDVGAAPVSITYSSPTYGPSSTPPTAAGIYTVVASVTDTGNYLPYSVTNTFTNSPAPASVSFSNTNPVYSGAAQAVVATVTPTNAGTPLITYSNSFYPLSSNAPTNVGDYIFQAALTNPNYVLTNSDSGTLSITPYPATVTLSNTNQTYTGTSLAVTTTTDPTNASPVSVTYSNTNYPVTTNPPTNAGLYSVLASVTNTNYSGFTNGTFLISPATSTVTLGSLSQTYDGSPKSVAATTLPPSLAVSITYSGSPSPPTAIGSYPVTGTVTDPNYTGSSSGVLAIADSQANWRNTYFGTPNNLGLAADSADSDGDGYSNAQEYALGTDPTSPDKGPLLTIANSGGSLSLGFLAKLASGAGYGGYSRYYTLEGSSNLKDSNSWSPLSGYSNIFGNNQSVSVTLPISGQKFFYRLRAWLQ